MACISESERTLERAVGGAYFNTWLLRDEALQAERSGASDAELARVRYEATLKALGDLLVHFGEDLLVRDVSVPLVHDDDGFPILTMIPSMEKTEALLLQYAHKYGLTEPDATNE